MIDDIDGIVAASASIPGWREGDEGHEVALASYSLPHGAVIAEIGVFMGRSTMLLAGPRRLRGSGQVHCVDPFDCSGDPFSVPFYISELKATGKALLEDVFQQNITEYHLSDWVEVHKGIAQDVATGWFQPLDLLLLDGDHSPQGARAAYDAWIPFLRRGGVVILGNTRDRAYAEGHDGNRRLAVDELVPPRYSGVRQVGAATFAIKQFCRP